MDSVRTEGSVLSSLGELRAIEAQRQADERAAIEAAHQARRAAREVAARAEREAIEARATAERAARLAVEQARADAERDVRMHAEAIAAAERARHEAELEQARQREERALRREVSLRQRPRWMIAVTSVALCAAAALGTVAYRSHRDAAEAVRARLAADAAAREADAVSRRLEQELARQAAELQQLEARIRDAIARLEQARTDAARQAASDQLRALERRKAELAELERTRGEIDRRRERLRPVILDPRCLHDAVCR